MQNTIITGSEAPPSARDARLDAVASDIAMGVFAYQRNNPEVTDRMVVVALALVLEDYKHLAKIEEAYESKHERLIRIK